MEASEDNFNVGILVEMTLDSTYSDGFASWADENGVEPYEELLPIMRGGGGGFGFEYDFTWLQIPVDNLQRNKFPSELMQDAFAGDRNSMFTDVVSQLNISYIGQAVLAWLPEPLHNGHDNRDIFGFLDHRNRFGLAYGWDVFANFGRTTMAEILEANDGPTLGVQDYVSDWDEVSNSDHLSSEQKYKYWPPYRSNGTGNNAWSRSWADQRFNASTTYCVEAVGVDYMDTTVRDTTTGTATLQTVTNPNYILSSNEIFPVDPNILEWCFKWTSHAMEDDQFVIRWGDGSPDGRLTTMMKVRYTAKGSETMGTFTKEGVIRDSIANLSAGLSSQSDLWQPYDSRLGTHTWEKNVLDIAIKKMCDRIQDGYEVIDLPKKLLNKVQKRGRIPDAVVSAFGYVPPDDDAYRSMLAGVADGTAGLTDYLKMNPGAVQYGPDDGYDPSGAVTFSPVARTPWTYTDADGEVHSVTWEEYVSEGGGTSSGFDEGTYGSRSGDPY
jgi:hypothetical protein